LCHYHRSRLSSARYCKEELWEFHVSFPLTNNDFGCFSNYLIEREVLLEKAF
jgi:hypothetical protein